MGTSFYAIYRCLAFYTPWNFHLTTFEQRFFRFNDSLLRISRFDEVRRSLLNVSIHERDLTVHLFYKSLVRRIFHASEDKIFPKFIGARLAGTPGALTYSFSLAQSGPYRFSRKLGRFIGVEHGRKNRPRVSRTCKTPRCKCARSSLFRQNNLSDVGFRLASNPAGHRSVSTIHFLYICFAWIPET